MSTASLTTAASSPPLRRLLAGIRRRARGWIWVESVAIILLAAAGLAALTLALDWLLEPPVWARGLAMAAAAGLLIWLVATRLIGRLATPLPDRSLALAIERRHPSLGDTLSTAVGLAAEPHDGLDPDLIRRTVAAAGALADGVRPGDVFRRGRLAAIAIAGAMAAAAVGGFVATQPLMAETWARRMMLLQDLPWPRRVQLEAAGFVNGVRKVARGSDVDVVVRARTTGPAAESVFLRSPGDGSWQSVRMGTRGSADGTSQVFGHVLERVMADTPLEIRGGDARLRGLMLQTVEPPAIAAVSLRSTLPAYLGGGERQPPAMRVVPVPRGSLVEVAFTATKPLSAATITARFADDAAADETGLVLAAFGPTHDLPAGNEPRDTIMATLPPLESDTALTVTFTDQDGIANREPVTLLLSAVPDEPPQVAVRMAGISTAVTPQGQIPVIGSIADDHGLAAAWAVAVRGEDSLVVPLDRIAGGEPLVELSDDTPLSVPLAGLALAAGDRLELTVSARDMCGLAGGPNEASGDTWTLEVVSPEALQAMLEAREILLRRRYEAAIEDLAQTRRGLDDASGLEASTAASRLAEAAARGAGESGEIATAFREIRAELAHNGLLTPEVENRLVAHVADPVAAIGRNELAELPAAARGVIAGEVSAADLASGTDRALKHMREVLDRMLELESYNEVIEKLRGVIEIQEQIRAETLERQRRRAREALEGL